METLRKAKKGRVLMRSDEMRRAEMTKKGEESS
jgi:hypothetical protein